MKGFELELLTDDPEMVSLAHRYWAHDEEGRFAAKVADLASQYGVRSSNVAKTVATIATARSTEVHCVSCEIGKPFTSRADFTQDRSSRWHRDWMCVACTRAAREREAELAEARRNEQAAVLWNWFRLDVGGSLDPSEFTLEQAVALLSLIRVAADENLASLHPLERRSLSPFRELDDALIAELYAEQIIQIDPVSDVEAFGWEDGKPAQYFTYQVGWQIRVEDRTVDVAFAQSALEESLRAPWCSSWREQRYDLWRRLALGECLEYLRISLDDHGLTKEMGEKTRHVLENALNVFSIGQVYSFIWRAAKDAAAFYVRESVSKRHAANTVVGAIERSAERALVNDWDVAQYRRDRRIPESPMVQVFTTVSGLGERYWTEVPGADSEVASNVPDAGERTT